MSDKEQTRILAVCLEAMAAGASPASCLARYPDESGELASMLFSAVEVARVDSYDLSAAARLRARARLRQAQAAHGSQPRAAACWSLLRAAPAARTALVLALALVCLVLSGGVVAASQPGDLAYGVRLIAERVPAWMVPGAKAQSDAEFRLASRRLAELRASLGHSPEKLDPRTVAALLASDERSAELALSLPPAERAAIAARLAEQARTLKQLGQAARQPQDTQRLFDAAVRAAQAANRASPDSVPPAAGPLPTTLPQTVETSTSANHRSFMASSVPSQTPTRTPVPRATVTPTPAATRATLAPRSGPVAATPAGGVGRRKTQTPMGRADTAVPAHAATPQAADPTSAPRGPEATSPGPGPAPASPGSGPEPASPGPGPGPASSDPGPETTSPGPGPEPPSSGPRPPRSRGGRG